MGSLPNLNQLCRDRAERRLHERERDLAREQCREREFSRGSASAAAATTRAPVSSELPRAATERQPIMPPQASISKHQLHHRHSLTARKVHRTRSSGATHHLWEDPMIEHMTGYSPISSRSHRTSVQVAPYHIQTSGTSSNRRRESVNSSIGATSIRRLLTVNRGGCRYKIPVHIKTNVKRNFVLLVLAHGLTCSILIPVFGLQGSSSTWFHKEDWINLGPNIGSLLLSVCFIVTAGMCLLTRKIIKQLGYVVLLALAYASLCLFLMAHVYPNIYTLILAYVLLGLTLGPAWICKWNLVVYMASRISCGQQECGTASSSGVVEGMEEHKMYCNRDERIRRLARWFHAAENIGIMGGAVVASFVMTTCASHDCTWFYPSELLGQARPIDGSHVNGTADSTLTTLAAAPIVVTSTVSSVYESLTGTPLSTDMPMDQLMNTMFNVNGHGERICGADACPVSMYSYATNIWNISGVEQLESHPGSTPLVLVYLAIGLAAFLLTVMHQPIDNTFREDRARGSADTLLFAGPLAYFVGTEQGYMLGDFTKAFVSCSLGPHIVACALIGMGIMQLIVACTLSMLLRHTKRYAVLAAGFFFHACLLLVLSSWKPSTDDSALFYVIAAAWGACNAMWETLLFALITLTHVGHVIEIASPIQALRFVGLSVTFAAHGFLCENQKILIMFVLLVITVLPYGMLEARLEAQRKNHHTHI